LANILPNFAVDNSAIGNPDEHESYFMRLSTKDIPNQTNKILEHAMNYYNKGQFTNYNNVFGRYIKNMRDLSEAEMNNFIVKFVFSSIFKKNIENAISDLNTLKQQYIQYDLNIYIL
jgi:hypothetical protein